MTSPPTGPHKGEDASRAGDDELASGHGKNAEDATLAQWYRMAGVGIEFIVAVVLFAGIGYAIDRWLDSSPWGLLIGAGVGFAVGLRAMIRVAMKSFR